MSTINHALHSQVALNYNLYFDNWKMVNPASITQDATQKYDLLRQSIKNQITGISSVLFTYENNIKKINSSIGIIVENDQLPYTTNTLSKILYSYHFKINDDKYFNIGTSVNYSNNSLGGDRFRYIDPNDPILTTFPNLSSYSIDFDLGVVYRSNNLETGISMINVLKSKYIPEHDFISRNLQLMTLYSQYKVKYSKLNIIPSIYVITDYRSYRADILCRAEIKDLLIVGLKYQKAGNYNLFNVIGGIKYKGLGLTGVLFSSDRLNSDFKIDSRYELNLSVAIME